MRLVDAYKDTYRLPELLAQLGVTRSSYFLVLATYGCLGRHSPQAAISNSVSNLAIDLH
jgi:hypothetical protein